MEKFANKNIFISGIRRSGNHAIASWVTPQLNSDVIRYYNDHFYDKLLLLKNLMNTKTGKKLARERHSFLKKYLKQFFKEWKGMI